jgi:hypothetical protein
VGSCPPCASCHCLAACTSSTAAPGKQGGLQAGGIQPHKRWLQPPAACTRSCAQTRVTPTTIVFTVGVILRCNCTRWQACMHTNIPYQDCAAIHPAAVIKHAVASAPLHRNSNITTARMLMRQHTYTHTHTQTHTQESTCIFLHFVHMLTKICPTMGRRNSIQTHHTPTCA